jgi:hypothetical protein
MCTRGRWLAIFEKSVAAHKVTSTYKNASSALHISRFVNSGVGTSGKFFKTFFSLFSWCVQPES